MACKEEKRQIGDNEYYCRQWAAEKSVLMKLKLGKLFGPAFTELISEFSKGNQNISSAVEKLFSVNEPEVILAFMKEVVSSATCNGERITITNFNDIFSDNLLEFYQVFFFVLELNYKRFLSGKPPGLLGMIKKAVPGGSAKE